MKRAFHVVYTLLALNFILPAVVYAVAPDRAVASFVGIGAMFGVPYGHAEDSVLWRVLAIANVGTLGFLCVLVQVDLKRYWATLYGLWFLKSMASLGFAIAFVLEPYPGYLAAALLDGVSVALMVVFARGARREIA